MWEGLGIGRSVGRILTADSTHARWGARTQAILAAPAPVQTETPRCTGWLVHMATDEASAISVNTDAVT